MTPHYFSFIELALCLFGLAVVIFIAGVIIVKHDSQKQEFWEDVAFMKALIKNSEVSLTAYRNCLEAFREFDSISYRDKKAFASLWTEFHFKFRDFLPESEEPKIKIIPDNSEVYYNYKIEV
jgi:hypothetical protein